MKNTKIQKVKKHLWFQRTCYHALALFNLAFLLLLSSGFWYNVIFGGLNSVNCFSSCRNASSWANELLNFPTRTKAFLLPPDQRNFLQQFSVLSQKGQQQTCFDGYYNSTLFKKILFVQIFTKTIDCSRFWL